MQNVVQRLFWLHWHRINQHFLNVKRLAELQVLKTIYVFIVTCCFVLGFVFQYLTLLYKNETIQNRRSGCFNKQCYHTSTLVIFLATSFENCFICLHVYANTVYTMCTYLYQFLIYSLCNHLFELKSPLSCELSYAVYADFKTQGWIKLVKTNVRSYEHIWY